jgi:hypothetical protein
MVVVLPTPLTPMTSTTSGGFTALMRRGVLNSPASSSARKPLKAAGSVVSALRARAWSRAVRSRAAS